MEILYIICFIIIAIFIYGTIWLLITWIIMEIYKWIKNEKDVYIKIWKIFLLITWIAFSIITYWIWLIFIFILVIAIKKDKEKYEERENEKIIKEQLAKKLIEENL